MKTCGQCLHHSGSVACLDMANGNYDETRNDARAMVAKWRSGEAGR